MTECKPNGKLKNNPVRMCVKCRVRENQALLHRFQIINGKIQRFGHYNARSFYTCKNCYSDSIFQDMKLIKYLSRSYNK